MSKNGKWRKKNAARERPAPAEPRESPIRVATPEDAPGIMDLLRQMHAENGLEPLDEAKVGEFVGQAIARRLAMAGVIGEPGRLEAAIGLFVGSWWYSSALHLEDRWNFVHPDHRVGTSHAANLIAFAKRSAQQMGIPLLMGITSAKRTAGKVRLYERQMGDAIGAIFWQQPGRA
jgi:hypothetical protein